METDEQNDFIASDTLLPGDETPAEASKHPQSDPGVAAGEEDVEDIGSDDDEDEEDDDAEIDLDEDEVDEEEDLEGEDDEEMVDLEGHNGEDTMQSIENNVPSNQPVPQTS